LLRLIGGSDLWSPALAAPRFVRANGHVPIGGLAKILSIPRGFELFVQTYGLQIKLHVSMFANEIANSLVSQRSLPSGGRQ
jgi:hypothetical protein